MSELPRYETIRAKIVGTAQFNEDLFMQPTERALYAKAYQCPNFFWSPKSRLGDMAEYYHKYHMRLQWNAKGRSVVVDLDQ